MTTLMCLENPVLLLMTVCPAVFSVLFTLLKKNTVLSYICAIIHAVGIAAIIYFGGTLSDIFFMLALSLALSSASICIKKAEKNKEDRK